MKTSAYKPTLNNDHLKRIDELKKTGSLTEKQQKKLDVLTMTHSGEKRETIAEKLGINMDTITEWKKLFAKEGMDVYLGLQKAVKTLQSNTKRTSKEIVSQVKELGKKVEKKFQEQNTDPSEKESAISQFEQHLVEVLKNSYNVVVQAIQTYSESHGPKSKSKILKTYKKELKNAKKLIKEWTKKVEELKKDMKKKNKKDENKKDKKEDKKNKEHSENKKDADHKKDKKDSKKD